MEVETTKNRKRPVANKRKVDNAEADKVVTKKPRNEKHAEMDVDKNVVEADLLVFGSGEQGNQLPPELTGKVKFRRKAALIKQFENVKLFQVVACGFQTGIVTENKQVYMWGCSDDGALGRVINQENKDVEEATPGLVNVKNIVTLSMGSYHSMALTDDGKLRGWGGYKEEGGFLGFSLEGERGARQFTPININFFEKKGIVLKDVQCGFNDTIALSTHGKVYEWGAILNRLNRRTQRPGAQERERIAQLTPTMLTISGVKHIFAGGDSHFAVDHTGNVYSWGINGFGQLGTGDNKTHMRPHKLKGFPANIKQIACGASHCLLLTEDGQVFSWGRNAYGQLGQGEDEPAPERGRERAIVTHPKKIEFFSNLPEGNKAIKISCGDNHSAVVTSTGQLYTFGFGEQYRLGNCTDEGDEEEDVLSPFLVRGAQLEVRKVVDVACACDHTMVFAQKVNDV